MDIYSIELQYNDNGDSINVLDFIDATKQACEKLNIDFDNIQDMNVCNSTVFNNAITPYIYHVLLKPTKVLLYKGDYITNNSNYNFNKDTVLTLTDIYIYLCNIYNKRIAINGICGLLGVSDCDPYLTTCKGLNTLLTQIQKKVDNGDSKRQQDRASDSHQSILNLAYNNYKYNWSGQIKTQEMQTVVKSLSDIQSERQQLSVNGVQNDRISITLKDEN